MAHCLLCPPGVAHWHAALLETVVHYVPQIPSRLFADLCFLADPFHLLPCTDVPAGVTCPHCLRAMAQAKAFY